MTADTLKVSHRGQMSLPALARRRWGLQDGGTVEVVDLGDALLVIPSRPGGVRAALREAIDASGGYSALVKPVVEDEPELA